MSKKSESGSQWTKASVIIAALALLLGGISVPIWISISNNLREDQKRQEDFQTAEELADKALDEQARSTVLTLSRKVTDGFQALTIHNNSSTPLINPQVVYNYTERPATGTSGSPDPEVPGPILRLDPEVGIEGCPDQASEQFVTRINALGPGQEVDVEIPASPKGDEGNDIYIQFQESNERGQWWELRIGEAAEEIVSPFVAQPGSPCFTGRVSLTD